MTQVNERNEAGAFRVFGEDHGVGDAFGGTVTSVVGFGAFVELAPGVEGLLHESETKMPPRVGDVVGVTIDGMDRDTRRISLRLS